MTESHLREHYVIGDLLWAKIGSYPFWPCMVSYDPNLGCYTKIRKVRNREERIYHVQYFGKQVQHGWTTPGSTFLFEGYQKFEMKRMELINNAASASDKKKVAMKYRVLPSSQDLWLAAIKEAEWALEVNPEDRFETFVFKYEYPKKFLVNGSKHKKKLGVNGVKHHNKAINGYKKRKRTSKKKKPKMTSDPNKMLSNGTEADICRLCETENINVTCAGVCNQAFHKSCLGLLRVPEGFKCVDCERGLMVCCICKDAGGTTTKCSKCANHYHDACALKYESVDMVKRICPSHCCLRCSSESARNLFIKAPLTHCFRCPSVFHANDRCIPAGSVKLTTSVMICPEHFLGKNKLSPQPTCNVNYCTICSEGGDLICCESCPNSYHAECISQAVPSGDFFCESCSRKQYLYPGTIVWAKTGSFRWWPAEIVDPKDLPSAAMELEHHDGEFPVQYFGTYEFYWTHRGRVIPYVEDHKNYAEKKISKPCKFLEKFNLSLKEAAEAYSSYVENRSQEMEGNGNKPGAYKHIQVNRPVPPAEITYLDASSIFPCSCNPDSPNPCSYDSACINRSMLMECHPEVCTAKDRCENMKFQKRQYANVKVIKTKERGWGLRTCEFIKRGSFVIEYVGEIITHEEYQRRVLQMRKDKLCNYYFLYLDSRRLIDAGPRGNLSRFINHSCDPNCEMVKWSVNGDARIGIFALNDIEIGEELTFNYQFDSDQFQQKCNCGATNCLGIIGRSTEKVTKKKKVK